VTGRETPSNAASRCLSDGVGCFRDDCGWPDQPCAADEPSVLASSSGEEDGPEGNEGRALGSHAALRSRTSRLRRFIHHARLNHRVGARWLPAIRVAWKDTAERSVHVHKPLTDDVLRKRAERRDGPRW
jgi:hypothetical protein